MDDKAIIAKLNEDRREPIFVSFSDFNGKKYLDIRKVYKDEKTGEMRPTKKGISLDAATYELLMKVLEDKDVEIHKYLNGEL